MNTEHITYSAKPDLNEEFYWERVNRNLGWLGATKTEQRERQEKLRDVVIGVAGCGGIGGATADRLVRMGVRNLKLADPDTFEISNITSESLCSRRISAMVSPKFVRMTRLKLGRDTSCVRHALTPSEFMPVPPTNDFTA